MDLIAKDELVQYLDELLSYIEDCHNDYLNGVEGSEVNKDVRAGAVLVISNILTTIPNLIHEGAKVTNPDVIDIIQKMVRLTEGGADNDTCRENQTV